MILLIVEEIITNLFSGALDSLNYWWIVFFMTIESSFIPFPSEVVVPPAAYKAATTGELNVFLVVVCATLGAIIGALVNYGLARYLGRPLVYRFAERRVGHMCLIDREKVENAERYFDEHGAVGTFFGRLVPAVRQLISIPAGLARMSLGRFVLYTTLGAGLWNSILAGMGWYIGHYYSGQLEEKVAQYSSELKIAMLALGVIVVLYLVYKGVKKN